jgi:hypothetical protein
MRHGITFFVLFVNVFFLFANILIILKSGSEHASLESIDGEYLGEKILGNPQGDEELSEYLKRNNVELECEAYEFTTYADLKDACDRGVHRYIASTKSGNVVTMTYFGRCQIPILLEPKVLWKKNAGVFLLLILNIGFGAAQLWKLNNTQPANSVRAQPMGVGKGSVKFLL